MSELYSELSAVISTKSWTTVPIHLQLGVYQGDPLSVIIFNTVMNTAPDISVRLASGFNHSLECEQIPHVWKSANVTPVQKGGGSVDISNFQASVSTPSGE